MSSWHPSSSSTPAPAPKAGIVRIEDLRVPMLLVGVIGLLVSVIYLIVNPDAFFRAYLFAWLFWLALPLGGMALAALHYQTGGNWGRLSRSIMESQALLLPVIAVLFIPVLAGLKYLFPWAVDSGVHAWHNDPVLVHRHPYMNPSLFAMRFIGYFVIWFIITILGVRTAAKYDRTKSTSVYDNLSKIGSAYLVFYVALITLAGVDWIMSREPHWTTSIFGFIMVVDQCLTALVFAVIILSFMVKREPLKSFSTPELFNDLGNLMLTLVILWTYMNFAQFLITWTGNEQEDVGWYVQRTSGGWMVVSGLLIFVHFFVPFFALLSRSIKRNPCKLAKVAMLLFVMQIVDMYWIIVPGIGADSHKFTSPMWQQFSLAQFFTFAGIGGVTMFFFLGKLQRRPLLPEAFPEEAEKEMSHGHAAPQAH